MKRQTAVVNVPASTSNLGSGFDTLGLALGLTNRITLTRKPRPGIELVSDLGESEWAGATVMVFEASKLFFNQTRSPKFGFAVTVSGSIPSGRGLGSSVTVRLGVLAGLNELADAKLSRKALFEMVAELEGHPDNAAPAVFGGFTVAGRVDGELADVDGHALELLREELHRVDDALASAQIHFYNREQVLLGLITHSPFFARYSPGELHILMTAAELGREEIPVFDLTPGGQYKDRYATHHDEVHIITIFFRRADCVKYKAKRQMAEAAKQAALRVGITPEQTRDAASSFADGRRKWTRMGLSALLLQPLRLAKRRAWHLEEVQIYENELASLRDLSATRPMTRDQVRDLLLYEPRHPWQPSVNKFMKQAIENLESGEHVYTRVENGRLVAYGWLSEPQTRKPAPGEEAASLPPADAVVLHGLYSEADGPMLPPEALAQLLRDAAAVPDAARVLLEVPAANQPLRTALQGLGFRRLYSDFARTSFGKTTRWSTQPAPTNSD